jgi:hypothetical protein
LEQPAPLEPQGFSEAHTALSKEPHIYALDFCTFLWRNFVPLALDDLDLSERIMAARCARAMRIRMNTATRTPTGRGHSHGAVDFIGNQVEIR